MRQHVFPEPPRPVQKTGGDARSAPAGPAPRRCSGTRIALVGLKTVTRAVQRQLAHQAVARDLGDDRGCRNREHHARRRQSRHRSRRTCVSSRSRPSTNTCLGISGSACTARASAHSDARRILSRSILDGEAKATANDAVAQISSNSCSRRSGAQPLGIVDPLRNALRVEHHRGGHHRAGQRTAPGLVAAGHRPDAALDQRALASKARRRHRDHTSWPA